MPNHNRGQGVRRGQVKTAAMRRDPRVDSFRTVMKNIVERDAMQDAIAYRMYLELYGYEPIVISKDIIRAGFNFSLHPKKPMIPKELPQPKPRESIVNKFAGWTRSDLKEYSANGYVPPRFRNGRT